METPWLVEYDEEWTRADSLFDDEKIHPCERLDPLHGSSVPEGGLGQQIPRDNTTKSRRESIGHVLNFYKNHYAQLENKTQGQTEALQCIEILIEFRKRSYRGLNAAAGLKNQSKM